ncbi:unnamed protein product [Caenorhabditis auriculariae]|uniref:FYVE-type domain-containing protein n=1 Tax=Caenorhabditis auriculariae TaxID=2777116 RepID=A0A8S1GYP4_9PELO|nr:unnamed protein product [Caenorhabditis auriculariae]
MTEAPDLLQLVQGLSPEEQAVLRGVFEKDLEFQRHEKARLKTLKTNVEVQRWELSNRKASVPASLSSESCASNLSSVSGQSPFSPSRWSRNCAICSSTLGFILNSGTKCRKCSTILCDRCRTTVNSKNKESYLCPICYQERELEAATNSWTRCKEEPEEDVEQASEALLNALRRVNFEKRMSLDPATTSTVRSRAPFISRRNLTLPSIQTNFLGVPDESEVVADQRQATSQKFWGGSPSPRSPRRFCSPCGDVISSAKSSPGPTTTSSSMLVAMHPREPIGSPAPRPFSTSPLSGVPEEEVKQGVNVAEQPQRVDRRRSAFEGTRRSGKQRRQSEVPVPSFRLSIHSIGSGKDKEIVKKPSQFVWVEVKEEGRWLLVYITECRIPPVNPEVLQVFLQMLLTFDGNGQGMRHRSLRHCVGQCITFNEIFRFPNKSEVRKGNIRFTLFGCASRYEFPMGQAIVPVRDMLASSPQSCTKMVVGLSVNTARRRDENDNTRKEPRFDWIISV